MNVEERIETIANRVLWCVCVIGPDDVYAEPTHAAAVAHADALNRAVWGREDTPDDVTCFSYADVWPWSKDAHVEDMAKQAEAEAKRKAARTATV